MTDGMVVHGGDQLVATLHQAGQDLADLSDANTAAGGILLAAARSRAPKRTGQLAGSLRLTTTAAGFGVASPLVWAGPIHWGWRARNISPNPFLYDGLHAQEGPIVEEYSGAIESALNKVHGA